MKGEGDEKGGVEGEFRTTQTPFEAFAALTPTFITTDYTDYLVKSRGGFLWNTKGERSWRGKVNEKN